MYSEQSLPKWAQKLLATEREAHEKTKQALERLRAAHDVLGCRDWFTIHGPPERSVTTSTSSNGVEQYNLFYLSAEGSYAACSLGVGDILLVGRKNKDGRS